MNYEQPYARTNKWMSTIIVKNRDSIMRRLKKEGIDTRPFFFPISTFPMYKGANTPNAHYAGFNGINLPSGIQRTEEEIKFISEEVNKCA
jgi:perosamine synthetase